MQYEENDSAGDSSDDDAESNDELPGLRATRGGAGYSPQARQRIEYLHELKRLRSQVGDDGIDQF